MYLGAVELHYTTANPNASVTSYYLFGGQRVAMNKDGTLTYLHGDHLGSASMATDGSGAVLNEGAFKPFGEPLGSSTFANDKTYTGQRFDSTSGGLMDYNVRFYSPVLGRFVSADSIVPKPSRPQDLNRYTYARNAPLRYTDPTGHYSRDEIVKILGAADYDGVTAMFGEGGKLAGKWGFLALLHRAQNGDSFYFYQYGMHPQGGMTPRARFVGIHFDGYKLSGAFYRDYDSAGSRPTLTNLPLPLENQLFVGDLYQLRRVSRGVDFNVATVRSDQQVRYRDTKTILEAHAGLAIDTIGLAGGIKGKALWYVANAWDTVEDTKAMLESGKESIDEAYKNGLTVDLVTSTLETSANTAQHFNPIVAVVNSLKGVAEAWYGSP